MEKHSDAPVYNSEDGMRFYETIAQNIQKPKDMTEIGILSAVRLLVYLPEAVGCAILSPVDMLPTMINHPDEHVRLLVKSRLQNGI